MIHIRKRDYYFDCGYNGCGQNFHIRTRKYIKQYYCPLCGAYCYRLSIIKNPLSRKNKENLKVTRELIRSNKQVLEELGIKK